MLLLEVLVRILFWLMVVLLGLQVSPGLAMWRLELLSLGSIAQVRWMAHGLLVQNGLAGLT